MPWTGCTAETYACQLQLQEMLYRSGRFHIALGAFCLSLYFGLSGLDKLLRRLCSYFHPGQRAIFHLEAQQYGCHWSSSQSSIGMKNCALTGANTFATPSFLPYELEVGFTFWVSLPSAAVMLGPLWSFLASFRVWVLFFMTNRAKLVAWRGDSSWGSAS